MTQLVPVINTSFLYVSNLNLSWASNTTLSVGAGAARDSNNIIDMVTFASTTINSAVVGANGLDTGTLAASTWYYVYMIGDSTNYNPDAFLISTSATVPYLPSGYDSYRRIGCAVTNGSTQFVKATQVGTGASRRYFYDTFINALTAGNATAYTAVSLAASVPPLANTPVNLMAVFTPNAAANTASFRPTGSSATSVLTISAVVASQPQNLQIELLSGVSSGASRIDYLVSSASAALTLNVLGFTDGI